MDLLKRLNIYQKERFPLVVLFFTTTSVVLSSSAVNSSELSWITFSSVFIAGLMYLFHIRVIDEIRDANHDATYHLSRPIQRGIISLVELRQMDTVGMGIFLVIGFLFGPATFYLGVVGLLYTFLAGKEFFLGERIRSRFFVYNAVNLVQMILLQFFVYSIFSPWWYRTNEVWMHLLFIFINAILLEVLRKIKITTEESIGHDTYSWHIGFEKSLLVLGAIATLNYFVFWSLLYGKLGIGSICWSLFFVLLLLISAVAHGYKKIKSTENLVFLSTLMFYVGLNLIIYFKA